MLGASAFYSWVVRSVGQDYGSYSRSLAANVSGMIFVFRKTKNSSFFISSVRNDDLNDSLLRVLAVVVNRQLFKAVLSPNGMIPFSPFRWLEAELPQRPLPPPSRRRLEVDEERSLSSDETM